MTKLLPGKPLIRETAAFEYTDPIIIELHPKHLVIRLKGQQGIDLDYTAVLQFGRRLRSAYARGGEK